VFIDEHLEALGQAFFTTMPLGEWAHQLWVLDDKGRADALRFKIFSNKLVNQTSCGARCSAFDALVNADLVK